MVPTAEEHTAAERVVIAIKTCSLQQFWTIYVAVTTIVRPKLLLSILMWPHLHLNINLSEI